MMDKNDTQTHVVFMLLQGRRELILGHFRGVLQLACHCPLQQWRRYDVR